MTDLPEEVGALLRRTAAEIVLPRFRSPETAKFEKGPGDWVTEADLASEAALTAALTELLPGSTVVGEEAVHADPQVLHRFRAEAPVWVIDPVDGTANYAAGREPFAILVALAEQGVTTHGWIYLPVPDRMLQAVDGQVATINGQPIGPPPRSLDRGLRGIVPMHGLAEADRASVQSRVDQGAAQLLPWLGCAGAEYPMVLDGAADFVYFPGSMPWDHAAGALALARAGGKAAYLDGGDFTVLDEERRPLLVARTAEIWAEARAGLLGDLA